MIPPFSSSFSGPPALPYSALHLQKLLQRSPTGLGRAGQLLPLPTAHLATLSHGRCPAVQPAGRCGLCRSRTWSQMPTPDKGATKCLLGPSPTLVQCRSLFHGDSHRDERMCLSDGATRPPDHSKGCFGLFFLIGLWAPLGHATVPDLPPRGHVLLLLLPVSQSTFIRHFLCAQPCAGCWGHK